VTPLLTPPLTPCFDGERVVVSGGGTERCDVAVSWVRPLVITGV